MSCFVKNNYIIPIDSINYVKRKNNSIYIILRRPVNGVTTISFEYDTEDDAIDALIALSELF